MHSIEHIAVLLFIKVKLECPLLIQIMNIHIFNIHAGCLVILLIVFFKLFKCTLVVNPAAKPHFLSHLSIFFCRFFCYFIYIYFTYLFIYHVYIFYLFIFIFLRKLSIPWTISCSSRLKIQLMNYNANSWLNEPYEYKNCPFNFCLKKANIFEYFASITV